MGGFRFRRLKTRSCRYGNKRMVPSFRIIPRFCPFLLPNVRNRSSRDADRINQAEVRRTAPPSWGASISTRPRRKPIQNYPGNCSLWGGLPVRRRSQGRGLSLFDPGPLLEGVALGAVLDFSHERAGALPLSRRRTNASLAGAYPPRLIEARIGGDDRSLVRSQPAGPFPRRP